MNSPVVLVTGSSRGLGKAMALAFARKGYAVGIHYATQKKMAQDTAKEMEDLGAQTLLLKADVGSSKDVKAMMEAVSLEWGRVDVLINNAGCSRDSRLSAMSDEQWDEVIRTNLNGVFYCTRSVFPFMRTHGGGLIINIGSYLAHRGAKGAANYAAAKAGVISLTKSTALEGARHNIRALAVLPGFHVTDMNRSVWEKNQARIRTEHLLGQLPSREMLGKFVFELSQHETLTGQVFSYDSRLS